MYWMQNILVAAVFLQVSFYYVFSWPFFGMEHVENDAFLDTAGLIRKWGYPAEQHRILTTDGYVLSLVRIPFGRVRYTGQATPVLLLHGVISSADDFVLNNPSQSLGFRLADAGYDVWILNHRGTPYSSHVLFNKHQSQYWEFSFDEMGRYDAPSAVDYILAYTNNLQLTLIGWSQGSTVGFVMLSERPEYNIKVELFVALAPVANISHIATPLTLLVPVAPAVQAGINLVTHGSLFASNYLTRLASNHFCNSPIRGLCNLPVSISVGASLYQLNRTRIPVYLAHQPSGTSTKNLVHFVQIYRRRDFVKYDYGPKKNMWLYGQTTSPAYNVENIRAPVALFWSLSDRLAPPDNVADLRRRINSQIVFDYVIPDPNFAHLDFVLGIRLEHVLFKPLFALLDSFHLQHNQWKRRQV